MTIRVAQVSDAEALSELVASLSRFFLDETARSVPEWFCQMISVREFEARLRSQEFYGLVYETEGEIVGYISIKQRFQIYHLFVSEQQQRSGIARALWSRVLDTFGMPKYFVRSSLCAVPVYKAFGFVEAGEVQSKDGIQFQPMERAAQC